MDFSKLPSELVSPMLHLVIQKLIQEVDQIWNVDKKLEELLATYEKIRFLIQKWNSESEDGWQFDDTTALQAKLLELDGCCYDTEDLVDYLRLSCISKLKVKGEDDDDVEKPINKNHQVLSQIFKSPGKKMLGAPHKIGELKGKLEAISSWIEGVLNARRSNNNSNHQTPWPSAAAAYNSTRSHLSLLSDQRPFVTGTSRDQDKQTIIEVLTCLDTFYGASIVGMDGLGKTALARSILADPIIKQHFPLIFPVSVSGPFQMQEVVHKLDATRPQTATPSHQTEVLGRQRALVILDDVWSVTEEDWDRFTFKYLKVASPGSRILATTRDPNVAEVTRTFPHYLDKLTVDDCQRLIMEIANLPVPDREIWNDDLELIAIKCKGMPVVANNFGLILSTKAHAGKLRDTILRFKNSDLWELPEFRHVIPCLMLNEPKLPPDLKRCVAYGSLFPPTHKFSRDELIQFWEIEGFVRPQQRKGKEPTGIECFEQLLSRSFLKPLNSTGDNQTLYEVHEFNHVFAQRLASVVFHRIDEGTTNFNFSSKNLRHLSLICENIGVPLLKKIEKCKGLRTFLLLHQYQPKRRTIASTFFSKLRSLRLLDLSHTHLTKLDPVGPLKLLRYLDLSNTDIQTLPESVCSLGALQILKLEGCSRLDRLPKDLNRLISLTHLYVNMKRLVSLPSKLGMLTNLQLLTSYIVGNQEGNRVAELKNMERLREICISRVENINDRKEAEESMISTKKHLRRLVLEWDNPTAEMANIASGILEGLQPHDDLEELVVRNYRCRQFPKWLSSPSHKLKLASIYLQNCQDCQVVPSLGQLPLLKILVLHSIDNVEKVDGNFCGQYERSGGFPSLESLEFREMGSLVSWTGLKEGDMRYLHTLKITGCQQLICLPSLIHQDRLVNLEINDCPALELLPELASSMSSECGKLIIVDSPLVEERCRVGGADWPKIKDMPCIKKFHTTSTSTTSTVLPCQNNQQRVVFKIKRCADMLNTRIKGGMELRIRWVVVLGAMLIPIVLALVGY